MDDNLTPEYIEFLRQQNLGKVGEVAPTPEEKNTYSFKELWHNKDVEQKFLLPDLIPANAVGIIIGEDGIGKTQIMTQLSLSIALGHSHFMGIELYAPNKRCMIVATEDSREKFTKAIVKQITSIKSNINPDEINIDFVEGSNFDEFKGFQTEIEKNLRKQKYDLIIIDALSDLFTFIDGEINSNSHARKLLSWAQKIVNTHSVTLMLIHHAAKTKIVAKQKEGKLFVEKGDSQGAGAITQKPRTILALSHDPKSLSPDGFRYRNYLHVVKANLMSKKYFNNAIELEFNTQTLLHERNNLVDINSFEMNAQGEVIAELSNNNGRTPKPKPEDIPMNTHRDNIEFIFRESDALTREEIVNKMKMIYSVGSTKIESKDGYLNYLIQNDLIVSNNGLFKRTIKSTEYDAPDFNSLNIPGTDAPF